MESISELKIIELQKISNHLRREVIKMIYERQAGHPGGSLSSAEIVTTLFFHTMRINPNNPNWGERDRFILSKGHASALLYAALARRGFFPAEDLACWGELNCHLQGHPDVLKTPGIDMTSGILGHGIAIGAGLCMAGRMQHQDFRVFTLLGDGECQAGIIWEGAMFAAKNKCERLIAILDYNDVQLDGYVHNIMPLEPIKEKWHAFNWHVLEINGHNIKEIADAFQKANEIHDKPIIIIAHTTKGKGVSFMENRSEWHGKAPNKEEYEQALLELEKVY